MKLKNKCRLAVLILVCVVSSKALFAAPSITSLSPTSAVVGASVTITGTNFGGTQGTSTVTFNGTTATAITNWSATSIVATVPTGATTGGVVVTVGGVSSNSVGFTVATASFTLTGNLATARMFQTATLLNSGAVLVAGGVNDGFYYDTVTSSELYNPATGAFTTTGSLNTGRIFNTATLVTNGQVLVAGGSDSDWNQIGSAELYNPASGAFTFTGSLNTPRTGHSATLLNNGGVLIAGGWDSDGDYITSDAATSELYDLTTGTFTPTGSLNTARDTHTATLLNNGQVLIAGGFDSNSNTLSSAELYDPTAGTFTLTGNLNVGRAVHTATLLNSGLVLIAGGYDINGNAVPSGELYDPSTGSFTLTGSMNIPRYDGAQGTVLNNGMVLLAGGQDNNGNTLASAELYDPSTGLFTLTSNMNSTRQSLTTTLLNSGQVLAAAGMDFNADVLNTAELYQPSALIPAGLVSIAVSPSNPLVSVGATQLFTATGTFSDNSTQTLDSVTWTSSDGTIAAIADDVSDHGRALAIAPSLVTVSACTGSLCGSTTMTVVGPPSIASLSPTSGAVGTSVTIAGTNFGPIQGASTVTINGTATTPSSWSATSIVVPVPAGATTGNVVVTVSGVASNGVGFVVVLTPVIANLSPTAGDVGTSVTITGANFGSAQGASTVTFNGTLATPTSWSATSIVVPVPTGATSGPLSVTVGGQTTYTPFFTVGTLPGAWLDADVGAVGLAGSSSYTNGIFTVSGAGSQFSGNEDAFHFVYQPLSGDGSIVARVTMPYGTGAEAGVMIRESLDAASANGNTIVPSAAIVEFNARTAAGGNTSSIGTLNAALTPYWVKLVRSGSTLSSYASPDGVNWTLVGSQTVNMTPNVYIGLVVASGTASPSLFTATFDNVSVSSAAAPAPVIASVSATTGTAGSTVLIAGANFGTSQDGSVVTLNATPTIVNSWSNTSISITIPFGATSGLLVVSVAPTMNDSNPIVFTVTSQSLPSGWLDGDVGEVVLAGSSSYTNGVFAVSGAGGQFSGTADAFHFVYQPLSGDGSIVARVVSVPVGEGASAGVMIRQTLDSASANGATVDFVDYGGVVEFNARTAEGGSTSQLALGGTTPPYWVELVRSGSTLSSYASPDGVNWTLVGNQTVNMAENVYVGLVSNSGNTYSLATATFDNVSVSSLATPAPVITSVSATTGTIGSTVVITGSNFGASQGSSLVTLNATPAIVNSWSNTSISITIPSGATSGPMVVSVAPSMNDSNPIEFTVTSQSLPSGWLDGDVGAVGITGNASYANGTFTVSGAGSQNSSTSDAFHFAYQPLSGDGSIVARVVSMPVDTSATAGVMIRETLDSGSANGATVDYGYYVAFNVRTATDGDTSQINSVGGTTPPYWLELVRSGSTLSSYASPDGANWTLVGNQTVNMAQNVDVGLVVNSGNTSSLATATFDNVAVSFSSPILAPSITNLSPNIAVPNAWVTIAGANFGSAQGTSTVTFNGTQGTAVNWSATSIVVPVPSGATSGNVVVTVGGVASNGAPFTVSPAPSISSLSSASGTVGTFVTITGVNFGSTQGASTVAFNGTFGTPTSWSATSVVVPVPSGATTGNVVVTVGGLASNGVPFTVFQTPSITNLSATSATIGASVTITGANFGATQGASTVMFNGTGGTPASWSPTSIVVPVPLGATTGNVVVTVNGISSNPVSMTVGLVSLPAVTQIRPANGATGVPENGRVIVRFAQPVQPTAVVSGTISLSQGVNSIVGTLSRSNDGLSVTFTPALNLPANAAITVTVTDVTENQTSPEFQSTFTTGSSTDAVYPTIVQTSPQNDMTGVPISAPIVVQFSKPMDPATLTPQAFTVTDSVSGAVSGMIQVDPTGTTASFVPQGFLSVGRTFAVALSSSIEDSSGNNLEGGGTNFGFTTAFTPDSTAPQMLGMSPLNGASAVPLNAVIVLEFSKPLNVISVSNGLQVESGGQPVPGGIALSNSNQQVTFTPQGGLAANTTYTVVTTSQITDVGGLALANPGTFSLTTGTVTDPTTPSVSSVSPSNDETEVPINGVVQLQFSKPVDPWTVTSATFQAINPAGVPVPGSVATSADGLTATLTPSGQMDSFTTYYVQATTGITDVEGHGLSSFESAFTTGSTTNTSAPTVLIVSPANGANNVPANVRVDLAISAPLSSASVGSSAVVVSAGGVAVPGTVTLGSGGTVLTFASTNLLAASTAYTVTASGFTDQAGNAVVPFTSSFTTGTSAVANTTAPTVVSVSPMNGATAVSVSSPIVLTFNEAVDATTVNDTTAPIAVNGAVLAGGYALDGTGTVVTFTPLSPLPGNMTVTVQVNSGLLDLSGNSSNAFSSTFTTGTGTDTITPVVTLVTPQNGATGIGPNAVAVLTFSKSLNPGTINTNNFALLADGNPLAISISTSADNQVVTLTPYGLPVSSTITVLVTNGVTDLSGNVLASFQSQFTTGPAVNAPAPTVVSQRPGNGASGVPLGTNVVLYLSEAMNASSVQAALQVSQNGALVSGTTQVTENGQVVQFTPSTSWQPSALVQVFLTPTAQSLAGNSASNYQASFTTIPNPSTTAPVLVATNPVTLANAVPTNVVVDFAFNEALDPTALTSETVTCFQNGNWFQTGLSLLDGGTLLQVTPRVVLAPNTSTNCQLGSGIQGVNGLPLSNLSSNALSFTTGAGPDTVVPTMVTTSPPNGSSNVGDNAVVRLVFSKPINPLTVNAGTIQLSGGGVTAVPDSISFSNNNQSALLVPHAPLPDGTQMSLTISGVTDVAGNAVTGQTTQFTTGTGPDVVPPAIVMASPFQNAQNVPINAVVILQMNQPVDPGTVNSSTLALVNGSNGQTVAGTYSVSTDGLTITFVPGAPLTVDSGYAVNFPGAGGGAGIADLAGNSMGATSPISFTTGTTASTSAPQVVGVSPANGTTALPINAQVVIQFNEPVNATKLSGVTLSGGSGTVNVSQSVTNGNQRLTLVPVVPLSPSTAYTLTIAGIQDFSGNVLPSPVTVSFTTGTGA
ncbi:MAG: Ig-like domain-containing protein, partial [Candidatus Sulfotelmatobacter sp.]